MHTSVVRKTLDMGDTVLQTKTLRPDLNMKLAKGKSNARWESELAVSSLNLVAAYAKLKH